MILNMSALVVACLHRNCALRSCPSTSPLRGYAQDERDRAVKFMHRFNVDTVVACAMRTKNSWVVKQDFPKHHLYQ
jgi:hypothetical protein